DLCARKCSPEEAAALDLSSLRLVINGGEPVRAATLDRFCERFAPAGFRRAAFWPSYGLAEASATVSGGFPGAEPDVRCFDAKAIETDRRALAANGHESHRRMVGCGRSLPGQEIRIVDGDSLAPLPDRQVGEIWVRGPSVVDGYFGNPEDSTLTFGARLGEEGGFLRTGDLGFLDGDELFVTGRSKDLIIVRGRNHYPQDIEATVAAVDARAIRPGCCAAFALEIEDEERLGLCAEVSLSSDDPSFAEASARLCATVYEEVVASHGIQPSVIVLLPPRGLSKTSSGKVQRREMRDGFREGTLKSLLVWSPPRPAVASAVSSTQAIARDAILEFLLDEVARQTRLPREALDPERALASFGFDSLKTLQLIESIESWIGSPVARTIPWERPSISSIAEHLAQSERREEPELRLETGARRADSGEAEREDVAIVGMACRFPGAGNPTAFWRLLRDGADAVGEIPGDRWDVNSLFDPSPRRRGRMSMRRAGTLEQVDGFDAQLFHVSPREAAHLDPQQRLFLELGWEALEDAGLAPDSLQGSDTGVFVGVYQNDYFELQAGDPTQIDEYYGTGILLSVIANRLSYFLGLQGPSIVVDTACSSSLSAVHLACQALRTGDCSLAIAGGVSLMLSPGPMIYFSQLGSLAPDGRVKAFSRNADGFVRSEGGGAVLLKPLNRALTDGDHVYAVLRGSAINHGGRSNGLMAPNPKAQRTVIRRALTRAGISGEDLSYLEAHGTGTALGDPIELEAIRAELLMGRGPENALYLGSVKGNIGHLEAAAGIAGAIKVALMLDRREIVPHLYGEPPVPELDGLPCRLPDRASPWCTKTTRFAGVSSFGLGGANAHVVMSEAFDRTNGASPSIPIPFLLSARTEAALRAYAGRMAEFVASRRSEALGIAATILSGRAHLRHRLAFLAKNACDLEGRLRELAEGKSASSLCAAPSHEQVERANRPVFVVPARCCRASWTRVLGGLDAHPQLAENLRKLLRSFPDSADASEERLSFLLATALHRSWLEVGLVPDSVVGVGRFGGLTARCLKGELSPEEVWREMDSRSAPETSDLKPKAFENRVVVILGELGALAQAILPGPNATVVALDGWSELPLARASCSLYLEGARADWRRLLLPSGIERLGGTPTYPFERGRYWTKSPRAFRNYQEFEPES
ncbi:MAG: beta-ketoacyl synthase N-terminal-like domain-containing protein, partial [Vicinamibacteria bacterium]